MAAQDYSKLKNAELETLLKERALPSGGKKADMVARLVEADKTAGTAAASTGTPTTTATTSAAAGTTPATSASLAAGGNERVANPAAVPNQTQAIDPAKTADLTVSSVPAPAGNGSAEPAPDKPAVDFSSGLASTSIDEEIAKRKARAEKFGIDDSDVIKSLERAKRFGTGAVASTESSEMEKGIGKLDEALSERPGRKRAREDGPTESTFDDPGLMKRARGRGGRFGGAGRSRGPGGRRGGGRGGRGLERGPPDVRSGGGGSSWMSDKDRAAAEARKAKFGS